MELLDHQIDEFIALYKKHHGVVLERPEALEKGIKLCRFVKLVTHKNVNEYDYGQK